MSSPLKPLDSSSGSGLTSSSLTSSSSSSAPASQEKESTITYNGKTQTFKYSGKVFDDLIRKIDDMTQTTIDEDELTTHMYTAMSIFEVMYQEFVDDEKKLIETEKKEAIESLRNSK